MMAYILEDDCKENDAAFGSSSSVDSFEKVVIPQGVNCLRTINTNELLTYLGPKDEVNTRRFPAVSFSRAPKKLNFSAFPGMYNIASIHSKTVGNYNEGRIFFSCPESRDRFMRDWNENYSKVFANVKIQELENFGKSNWHLPIKRFTFPDKFPYPLFHQVDCCFADLPDGDIKDVDIVYADKGVWWVENSGPHFFASVYTEKRKEIEEQVANQEVPSTVERPCLGSCVTVRSEKYPAARGVVYSRKANLARVFLVDYGTSEDFQDSVLHPITKDLIEIPFLAVPCRLATTENIVNGEVKLLFDLAKEKNLTIRNYRYRGFFNIVDITEDGVCSCLGDLLKVKISSKPLQLKSYTSEEMEKLKTEKRAKNFTTSIDHLTYLESQVLYRNPPNKA